MQWIHGLMSMLRMLESRDCDKGLLMPPSIASSRSGKRQTAYPISVEF